MRCGKQEKKKKKYIQERTGLSKTEIVSPAPLMYSAIAISGVERERLGGRNSNIVTAGRRCQKVIYLCMYFCANIEKI